MRKRIVPFLGVRVWQFALAVAISLAVSATLSAQCMGPGAPSNTETHCVRAVLIPGNPIRSFDISWVDANRGLYFLADRSNSGVDIISTKTNTFIGRAGGFVGIKLNPAGTAVDNNHSGPDGVVSRGNCLYAGDGNSTLRVYDISDPANPQLVGQAISTGGSTRLDEMALTSDGTTLIGANNAEDPPFVTIFSVDPDSCDAALTGFQIHADPNAIPSGAGLSIEQPTWVEAIQRFVVSVPIIANNSFDPAGCNYGQMSPIVPAPCSGAILLVDPATATDPLPASDIVPLNQCGPNGATLGPHGNVMVGCTPGNQSTDKETTIINAKTLKYVDVGNLTGSDEVWYNSGSNRYYTGSNRQPGGAVLGVVDGTTNFLLETIPQSSASHSVAADSERNEIYVPQVAPKAVVGIGGDTTGVGAGICGGNSGCVAVYKKHEEE